MSLDRLLHKFDGQPLILHLNQQAHRLLGLPRLIGIDADRDLIPDSPADRLQTFDIESRIGSYLNLQAVVAAADGIGSIPGAVIGGFILGLGETALVAMGYSTFSDAFTFILLIIILLIKPTGLFGEKTTDKV